MNGLIKTILTGFLAGCAGAFVIVTIMQPKPETKTVYKKEKSNSLNEITHSTSLKGVASSEAFVKAASISKESVVFIKTKSTQYNSYDSFWFFGGRQGQSTSFGSGVIFSQDGYIVTNYHVIKQSDDIEVIHGKRSYDATIVGYDKSTDLAVLKVNASDLPNIKLASSKDVKIGQWVLAVGNPFNLTSTVTAGIISAKGRVINVVNSTFPIESFIQTDAAINPGNSGGALVTEEGKLVGINTAILSETGSYSGYGFAVPIDIAKKVVDDIIKYGDVQKAYMGVEIVELSGNVAKRLGVKELDGVAIDVLEVEGAAQRYGLKVGDIILRINDEEVNSPGEFNEQISFYRPGDKVRVLYKRGDKINEATITLLNRKGGTDILEKDSYQSDVLGAELEVLTKAEQRKLKIEGGVRVLSLSGGLLQRLGISEGFVITSVNGVKMESAEELEQLLGKIRGRVTIRGISENGASGYYSYYF